MQRQKSSHSPFEEGRPTDSKVTGFVRERISRDRTDGRSALLPSAKPPKIQIQKAASEEESQPHESIGKPRHARGQRAKKAGRSGYVPVGLRKAEPHGWINSLMQLVLYLCGSEDLLCFIPRRYQPFLDFADQYFRDQHENRAVSSANSASLIRCMWKELSPSILDQRGRVNFYEVFTQLTRALFPVVKPGDASAILHPEWQVGIGGGSTLEEVIQKKGRPPEILISFEGENNLAVKKQLFFESDSLYYDLDAFVEKRPDGERPPSYIAYLKADGVWYQCDDERIVALRSNCLSCALTKCLILHYKRIGF